MTRASASPGCNSPGGHMQAEQPPDGAEQDSDGNWWIDLTRRQTLAGLGAAGSAVLAGLGAAQDGETVGGDRSVVGEDYQVRSDVELSQKGLLKELYVVPYLEAAPAADKTPSLVLSLDGGPRYEHGPSPYAETDTLWTNLAEIHVEDDPTNASIGKGPALVVSKQSPGIQLVVSGDRHTRTSIDGSAARVHGADTASNLPTLGSSEQPALEVADDRLGVNI